MKTLALLELEFALAVMQGCAEPIFMLPVHRKKACFQRQQQKRYVYLPYNCYLQKASHFCCALLQLESIRETS